MNVLQVWEKSKNLYLIYNGPGPAPWLSGTEELKSAVLTVYKWRVFSFVWLQKFSSFYCIVLAVRVANVYYNIIFPLPPPPLFSCFTFIMSV